MYIVLELQKANKTDEGAIAAVNTYENYNEAESRYYYILYFAAVSQLFLHGVYLFSEEGRMMMNRQYVHEPEPEPTPEPEVEPTVESESTTEPVEETPIEEVTTEVEEPDAIEEVSEETTTEEE